MKTPKQILFVSAFFCQLVLTAQVQWYQNQDGHNQPNGTYGTSIETLSKNSFVACYLWQMDSENFTWKISKSHTDGTEQRTFFLSGPSGIAEIKTGYRNAVYILFRSFPFAQDPQYTVYKLDSNLVIKAQKIISFPDAYSIFNLNVFELDAAGNVYLAGDGQYPDGPGYSPASFVMKTDKNLVTKWSRMDSVQTSYSRLHIERNGTVRLIEDFFGFFPAVKIQKISAGGQLLQTKTIQTDEGRQSLSSALDKDDNLLLFGGKASGESQSMYLYKLSRYTGNVVYRKTHFTAPGTQLDDLKLDEDGNIFALVTQYFATGSMCRISRISAGSGHIYWSRSFPFAQDSCVLTKIVNGNNDRFYVVGERRSGNYFSKGFALRMKKNGITDGHFPSPDSVNFQRSHYLLQGITDRDDQLIAIGNTNDLDTLTGAGTYYRSFAVRFGNKRHHHGCDDAERPGIESEAAAMTETEELPLTGSKPVIYPNPAQDHITISNIEKKSYNHIAVYNMLGTLLFQRSVNGNTARLDVSTLSGGVYLLVLHSSSSRKEQQLRFVVKR